MSKPSLPQGTRDFGAEVVRKRNYIFQTIRTVFEQYGFEPLETPALENLDTLMGKYGEEGDKLIFKILNNGLDNPAKREEAQAAFEQVLAGRNSKALTERALKYDLTIPFARYVAMNHGQLTMPFRRYQLQPVWRADRPQRGRYREFYQCDADVVGSRSLYNEAEFCLIYHTVFTRLGLPDYELRINHRLLLTALAESCQGADKMMDITMAIDKLDKIGLEKVKEELLTRGLNAEQVAVIEKYLQISGTREEVLSRLDALLGQTEPGKKGLDDIRETLARLAPLEQPLNMVVDPTLARGLNYYTGIIFEAKAPARVKMGSIGGGGRYDDLTGLFGVPGIPGVGVSFGVDRIYDVLEELQLFPAGVHTGTQVLFFNLGEAESRQAFRLMQSLREKRVCCELYHETVKLDKQFRYAEKKQIPHVVIIGSEELANNQCRIKTLATGVQETIGTEQLTTYPFRQG